MHRSEGSVLSASVQHMILQVIHRETLAERANQNFDNGPYDIWERTNVHVHVYVYVNIYVYTYAYAYVYIYACVYVNMYMYWYNYMYLHTYKCSM